MSLNSQFLAAAETQRPQRNALTLADSDVPSLREQEWS